MCVCVYTDDFRRILVGKVYAYICVCFAILTTYVCICENMNVGFILGYE